MLLRRVSFGGTMHTTLTSPLNLNHARGLDYA
jgi:hypothetical protein